MNRFLFYFLTFSQEDYFKIGNNYDFVDGKNYFFSDQVNALSIKILGEKYVIQKYDIENSNVSSTRTEVLSKKFNHLQFVELGNKLFLLYLESEKDQNSKIYAQEISFSEGKFTESATIIYEVKEGLGKPYHAFSYNTWWRKVPIFNAFGIQISEDKKYLLIQYLPQKIQKTDFEQSKFIVFDSDLKIKWEKIAEFKSKYKKLTIESMIINDKGQIVYLMEADLESSKIPTMFILDENTFSEKKFEFKIGKELLCNVRLVDGIKTNYNNSSVGNNLIIAGMTSNSTKSNCNIADGCFAIKLNSDCSVLEMKKFEFPPTFFNSRDQKSIENIELSDVFFQKDGSVIFVTEIILRTENPSFKENFIAKVNAKNELLWIKKISKNQTTTLSDKAYGTVFYSSGGNHYFIFTDNPKNKDLALDVEPRGHMTRSLGMLMMVKVSDNDGTAVKIPLINFEDQQVFKYDTNNWFQIANNKLFIELFKKPKNSFLLNVDLN